MSFYRLIKPDWAKPLLANGEKNPKFVEEILGEDVIDGYNFSPEFLTEKNNVGYNLYFFPNHPSKNVYAEGVKYLSGKHVDVFNFVFVDMDLKDKIYKTKEEFYSKVSEFPIKPTMVVDSGNGVHAYWRISDLTRDLYVVTQLALMKHFKTDESIFTVLQLMRLPGFYNTKKHKNYSLASIIEPLSSGNIYDASVFPQELYQALSEKDVMRGRNHLDKLDGKIKVSIPEDVNLDELPDNFIEFIEDPKNVAVYHLFNSPKETYGDRSGADLKLANILFKANFNKKEALAVISNTQKALSRGGHHRFSYAQMTVDKVYVEHASKYQTVGERLRNPDVSQVLPDPVKGTWYFDTGVLGNPWRKKEVLGLIAGSGVGKTSVTLKWIKDAIENNPDNDDVYIFFSLEMPVETIDKRWTNLVGNVSPLADRLYVIANEDDKGNPKNLGLQEMYEIANDIKKTTGKQIAMVAIDHIGIISKHIDTRKKHTFGIQSEVNAGWADIRTLSLNTIATQMKSLAKMLDTFLIVLTQTTKEKGAGDLPIDKDGAYGISQYENIMDRIVTIWQPLQRVQNQTKTRFLAWQYVKIREKHSEDKIQTYEPKLLTYDLTSGDLRFTTKEEYLEFESLLPQAIEIRQNLIKKKSAVAYSIHVSPEVHNKTRAALGIIASNGETR